LLNKQIEKIEKLYQNTKIDYDEIMNLKDIDLNIFNDTYNIRLINNFLFNFSKLQDYIGAKFFKNLLYNLKEIDTFSIPMKDVLNILEKLEIVNKQEWEEIREIRNFLSHEYPDENEEKLENLLLALRGFEKIEKIIYKIKEYKNAI